MVWSDSYLCLVIMFRRGFGFFLRISVCYWSLGLLKVVEGERARGKKGSRTQSDSVGLGTRSNKLGVTCLWAYVEFATQIASDTGGRGGATGELLLPDPSNLAATDPEIDGTTLENSRFRQWILQRIGLSKRARCWTSSGKNRGTALWSIMGLSLIKRQVHQPGRECLEGGALKTLWPKRSPKAGAEESQHIRPVEFDRKGHWCHACTPPPQRDSLVINSVWGQVEVGNCDKPLSYF